MDHAFEGKLSRPGRNGAARGEGTVPLNQEIGLRLQSRTGGGRNDAGDAAAVGELPVGGVDDGVHRLPEQVAANDDEAAAGGYLFLREDFFLRGTFAPQRRASDRPMAMAYCSTFAFERSSLIRPSILA